MAAGSGINEGLVGTDRARFVDEAPALAFIGLAFLAIGFIMPYRVGDGLLSESVAFGIRGLRVPLTPDAIASWFKLIGTFGLLLAAMFTSVRPPLRPLPIGIVMGVSAVLGLNFFWLLSIVPLGLSLWLGFAGCVLLFISGTKALRRFTEAT